MKFFFPVLFFGYMFCTLITGIMLMMFNIQPDDVNNFILILSIPFSIILLLSRLFVQNKIASNLFLGMVIQHGTNIFSTLIIEVNSDQQFIASAIFAVIGTIVFMLTSNNTKQEMKDSCDEIFNKEANEQNGPINN